MQLALNVSPNTAVPFTYASENPRIVAALSNGRLQAVKLGDTSVTVSYFGHEDTCVVRVVTKEEYLAMGFEIPTENGCAASVTGIVGTLALVGTLMGGVYLKKRREE